MQRECARAGSVAKRFSSTWRFALWAPLTLRLRAGRGLVALSHQVFDRPVSAWLSLGSRAISALRPRKPVFVSHPELSGQNSLCLWLTTPSRLTTAPDSGARDE